jgi:hypothetical protein
MTNERGRLTAADIIHSVQETAKVESSSKFERIRVSPLGVKRNLRFFAHALACPRWPPKSCHTAGWLTALRLLTSSLAAVTAARGIDKSYSVLFNALFFSHTVQ